MKIRVTALSDVRFYGNIVTQIKEGVGNSFGFRKKNTTTWVNLKSGQSREDISLVIGIDPSLLPDEQTLLVGMNLYVVPVDFKSNEKDKVQFYDLISMEIIET